MCNHEFNSKNWTVIRSYNENGVPCDIVKCNECGIEKIRTYPKIRGEIYDY
jgi:hypothetical protein